MAPPDNISDEIIEMRRRAQAGQITRPTRPQRAARAKELASEITARKKELGGLLHEYKRTARPYLRHEEVNWEENDARLERLNRIIETARVERQEVAAYLGMTAQNLRLYFRGRMPLSPQLEQDIERAVRELVEERRIQLNRAFALSVKRKAKENGGSEDPPGTAA